MDVYTNTNAHTRTRITHRCIHLSRQEVEIFFCIKGNFLRKLFAKIVLSVNFCAKHTHTHTRKTFANPNTLWLCLWVCACVCRQPKMLIWIYQSIDMLNTITLILFKWEILTNTRTHSQLPQWMISTEVFVQEMEIYSGWMYGCMCVHSVPHYMPSSRFAPVWTADLFICFLPLCVNFC